MKFESESSLGWLDICKTWLESFCRDSFYIFSCLLQSEFLLCQSSNGLTKKKTIIYFIG